MTRVIEVIIGKIKRIMVVMVMMMVTLGNDDEKKRMATMFNPEDKAYIKVNALLTVSVAPRTVLFTWEMKS